MKLIKIDKTVSPQQYHYKCAGCNKAKIRKQDIKSKTDYCHKCMLKKVKPRTGTSKYGMSAYDKQYSVNAHKIDRERKQAIDRRCTTCGVKINSCSELNVTTCTTCSKFNRGKTKSNKSGFVGVCYINPRERKNGSITQGYWVGRMKHKGKVVFSVEYKDSYDGTDEYKKLKCAVDRDIHIRENHTNHFKNFTDSELREASVMCGLEFKHEYL